MSHPTQKVALITGITGQDGTNLGDQAIVWVDPRHVRPSKLETLLGDASKAREQPGWTAKMVAFDEHWYWRRYGHSGAGGERLPCLQHSGHHVKRSKAKVIEVIVFKRVLKKKAEYSHSRVVNGLSAFKQQSDVIVAKPATEMISAT